MKKEIKHNCPEGMEFSNKAGKCINPKLEDENLNEKVPTKSLRFPQTLGKVAYPIGGKKRKN